MNIIYEISHIRLYKNGNSFELQIEDTELFDTIEDILVEQYDIEDFTITRENKDDISVYRLYFGNDTVEENLLKALKSISEKEVIEIYKMNNK